jgi:hypothetical protein
MENKSKVNKLTVTELKKICKDKNITGYSLMKKQELLNLLHKYNKIGGDDEYKIKESICISKGGVNKYYTVGNNINYQGKTYKIDKILYNSYTLSCIPEGFRIKNIQNNKDVISIRKSDFSKLDFSQAISSPKTPQKLNKKPNQENELEKQKKNKINSKPINDPNDPNDPNDKPINGQNGKHRNNTRSNTPPAIVSNGQNVKLPKVNVNNEENNNHSNGEKNEKIERRNELE